MKSMRMLLFYAVLVMTASGTAHAAHPLIGDDAGTLGRGTVQVELNGDIGSDSDAGTRTDMSQIAATLGIGITEKADVTFGVTRPWNSEDDGSSVIHTGTTDYSLVLKWQIFEQDGFSCAVKPQIGYSTAVNAPDSDSTVSYGMGLVFSKELAPFALHLNAGYTYNDHKLDETRANHRAGIWDCSLAVTYELLDGLKLVTDFGAGSTSHRATSELTAFALAGAIYSVTRSIDVSAGAKFGLSRPETDTTGTFGLTLKF